MSYEQLYTSQTASLKSLVAQSSGGLPIDQGLSQQANSVWSLFTAAYASDSAVRNSIVDQVWERVSSNATDTGIFSTAYRLDQAGGGINNVASPFIGGIFAPLALDIQNVTITVSAGLSSGSGIAPNDLPANPKKSSHTGAIVGGVIGGLAGAALLGLVVWLYMRRRYRRPQMVPEAGNVDLLPRAAPFTDESPLGPALMTETPLRHFDFVSAKKREATDVPPLNTSVSSPSESSGEILSPVPPITGTGAPISWAASSDTPVSHSDVQGLRTEMENLRRAVQTLHETRFEPPPGYQPGDDDTGL
ncbi:hypothetical protein EIP86_005882 [Pleurotus ostreatoroseus]|nr:hypothetical protein EIP86_005882 [Pleurotus ostreatoroseus]